MEAGPRVVGAFGRPPSGFQRAARSRSEWSARSDIGRASLMRSPFNKTNAAISTEI